MEALRVSPLASGHLSDRDFVLFHATPGATMYWWMVCSGRAATL